MSTSSTTSIRSPGRRSRRCAAASTGSPAASPARTSAPQARVQDLPESDPACSPNYTGSLPLFDPPGCSLRMSLLCALGALTPFVLHWRQSATPCGRSWWALGRSVRRTGATGSGLWPWATPTGSIAKGGVPQDSKQKRDLRLDAAKAPEWTAPSATDWKGPRGAGHLERHGMKRLSDHFAPSQTNNSAKSPQHSAAASEWQTPNAMAGGSVSRGGSRKGELLIAGQVAQASRNTNGKPRGSLNPAWVSQLMGYPADWLDLDDATVSRLLETASCRRSLKPSAGRSSTPTCAGDDEGTEGSRE